MRNKKKLKKWVKCFLTGYFFVLILPLIISVSAKYIGVVDREGFTSVAKPIINMEIKENNEKVNPVNSATYDFSVFNYDDTGINEVKLNYKISINFTDEVNVPLKLELYDISNNKKLNLEENTTIENFSLPAGTETIHNYQIIVSWNSEDFSYIYQNLERNINVSLEAEQSILGG